MCQAALRNICECLRENNTTTTTATLFQCPDYHNMIDPPSNNSKTSVKKYWQYLWICLLYFYFFISLYSSLSLHNITVFSFKCLACPTVVWCGTWYKNGHPIWLEGRQTIQTLYSFGFRPKNYYILTTDT